MLALRYVCITVLTNRLANISANVFNSDLTNMFAIDSVNIFIISQANIFRSESNNYFKSDFATCSPVTWPTCPPVLRPTYSPVPRPINSTVILPTYTPVPQLNKALIRWQTGITSFVLNFSIYDGGCSNKEIEDRIIWGTWQVYKEGLL